MTIPFYIRWTYKGSNVSLPTVTKLVKRDDGKVHLQKYHVSDGPVASSREKYYFDKDKRFDETLFFRFTETPEKDMRRGTSIHVTPYDTKDPSELLQYLQVEYDHGLKKREIVEKFKEMVAEQQGVDEDDVRWSKELGQWVIVLPGLCGFGLEENMTAEEAIEASKDRGVTNYASGKFVIYEGDYAYGDELVPDGDLFTPKRIVYTGDTADWK